MIKVIFPVKEKRKRDKVQNRLGLKIGKRVIHITIQEVNKLEESIWEARAKYNAKVLDIL